MAAGLTNPLPLNLDVPMFEDNADQSTIFCRTILQALADGTKTATKAAQEFDVWIVGESTRRLQEIRSRPELIERMNDGHISRSSTPNASGNIEHFFQGFPMLCAIFPPQHEGQTRVIAFLEALMAMPAHEAPDHFSSADDLSKVDNITLWSTESTRVDYRDAFRIHAAGMIAFPVNKYG